MSDSVIIGHTLKFVSVLINALEKQHKTLICIFKFQRTINKGICSISSDIIGDRYIQRRKRSVPVDVNVAALCILAHTLDHRNVMGGRAAYLREHLLIRDWPVGLHYTAVDVLKYIFHLSIPLLQTVNQVILGKRACHTDCTYILT